MINKLLGLWEKNKVLFCILLPLVIIAFGIKIFLDLNADAGRQDVIKAENKDQELKKEQDRLNNEANKEKAQADQIEDQINNLDEDEGWHKNK